MMDPTRSPNSGFGPRIVFPGAFSKQPKTPARIALMVFAAVLAIPILLFVLVAAVISCIVFVVLAVWNRLIGRHGPDWSKHDEEGRKGVRIRR